MSTDAGIVVDLSRWPIVVCRYPDPFGVDELVPFFDWAWALIDSGQSYVMVTDLRESAVPADAEARKLAADFATRSAKASADVCRLAVQVVSSKLVRMALAAVQAFDRAPYPSLTTESWDDAMAAAEEAAATIQDPGPPPPAFVPAARREAG